MLKRFFISMLGTMAGLWISLLIIFFGGIMLLAAAFGSEDSTTVKRHSILYFNLSGEVAERYQPGSLIEMIQSTENEAPSLDEMLNALRKASDDDLIDALYLDCRGSAMGGMASRQELVEAIRDFKINSGKPVYAYADTYSQGDYLLATTADSIYLNPLGAVDIHGVGGMTPFFRNALDKLGVKVQIIKVGTFKSAVEPFILSEMSQPARLQMQQYCDSLWAYAAGTIADSRAIETDTVRLMASQLIYTRPATTFVETGLVDHLAYRRQFNEMLCRLTGKDKAEDLQLVSPADYLASSETISQIANSSRAHVAVLYAVGDIVDSGNEGISGESMVPEIIALADDDNVHGLVMRVNSGGGSAFASEQIWEALEYFKSKNKPYYVSMGDYAASGGYYISCGADRIFADATTITGSIGVFGMIPDLSGLVTDKLGINFSTVETQPNAAGISLLEPMTPQQYAAMQRSVEDIYETFTGRVAAGRNMDVDSVKMIAEGRVWVGSKALDLGLVDELGSLENAVSAMTARLSLPQDAFVAYPAIKEEMWMRILRENANLASVSDGNMPVLDAETREYLNFINKLRSAAPVQARMEKVIIR